MLDSRDLIVKVIMLVQLFHLVLVQMDWSHSLKGPFSMTLMSKMHEGET